VGKPETTSYKSAKINQSKARSRDLFDLFMHCVLVAMGAELFQFHPGSGVTTVFHRGVARYAIRPLIGIRAALGTFQRDDNPYAFVLSHEFIS
jgi:hypothetical protein